MREDYYRHERDEAHVFALLSTSGERCAMTWDQFCWDKPSPTTFEEALRLFDLWTLRNGGRIR